MTTPKTNLMKKIIGHIFLIPFYTFILCLIGLALFAAFFVATEATLFSIGFLVFIAMTFIGLGLIDYHEGDEPNEN